MSRDFNKLATCIDMKEIWFWIANGQMSSMFDRVVCPCNTIMAGYYSLTFFFYFLRDMNFCMFGFLKVPSTRMRTAKVLARLCLCAGSSKPLLVAYVINALFSCAGSNCSALYEGIVNNCTQKRWVNDFLKGFEGLN